MILTHLFILLCGLGFLLAGGTILIPGSIALARHFKVPPRIVAFIIIAGGTSAPELLVSVSASYHGSSGIVWGNILGSNLANSLLVLGLGALAAPILTNDKITRWDLNFQLIVTCFILLVLYLNIYSGIIAIVISSLLISVYVGYLLRIIHSHPPEAEIQDTGNQMPLKTALIYSLGSIGALILGAELFVRGGIELARFSGWSEAFIGVTIIAIGTSLPEIISVGASILHKRADMAIGNVLGSNLFNLLIALSGAGFAGSLVTAFQPLQLAVFLLLGISLALVAFSYLKKPIGRLSGFVFIGFYAGLILFETLAGRA